MAHSIFNLYWNKKEALNETLDLNSLIIYVDLGPIDLSNKPIYLGPSIF